MEATQSNAEFVGLVEVLCRLQTEEEMSCFLTDLLTDKERSELSRRWLAARLLSSGETYSDIVQTTGLSSATVARISKWLQGEGGGYRLGLSRVEKLTIDGAQQSGKITTVEPTVVLQVTSELSASANQQTTVQPLPTSNEGLGVEKSVSTTAGIGSSAGFAVKESGISGQISPETVTTDKQ